MGNKPNYRPLTGSNLDLQKIAFMRGKRNCLAWMQNKKTTMNEQNLTRRDIVEILECTPSAIRNWQDNGLKSEVKIGREYVYSINNLREFFAFKIANSQKAAIYRRYNKKLENFVQQHEQLPTPPKYDPCRPFEKGDNVKPRTVFGRKPPYPDIDMSATFTIILAEDERGITRIKNDGGIYELPAVFLELIMPAEELEPYYLDTITTDDNHPKPYFLIKTRKHEHRIRTFYANDFETIEQTRAAAEAECARLNEQYRKEQA